MLNTMHDPNNKAVEESLPEEVGVETELEDLDENDLQDEDDEG
jgi:hypothetical protein